jgi:hypothetical protein
MLHDMAPEDLGDPGGICCLECREPRLRGKVAQNSGNLAQELHALLCVELTLDPCQHTTSLCSIRLLTDQGSTVLQTFVVPS